MGSSPSRSTVDIATPNRSRVTLIGSSQRNEATSSERSKRGKSFALSIPSAKKLAMAKAQGARRRRIFAEYPEQAVSLVTTIMNQLDENLEEDTEDNVMSASSKESLERLYALFFEHRQTEHRKILGDEIAANKGGKIFTKYMKSLSPRNSENSEYRKECVRILKSNCWNYCDVSDDFALALGRSGCFRILVDDIKRNMDDLSNNTDDIFASISILHNCAKLVDSLVYLNDANVLDVLVPLLKAHDQLVIKMVAILTVAYIIEEKDNHIISADDNTIQCILLLLQSAIAEPDNTSHGFSAEELVSGLMHLASNDKNKAVIVNKGALPMLTELLKEGNEKERSVTAKTIWELAFSNENKRKILDSEDLMDILRGLEASKGPLKQIASGAIWVLEEDERLNTVESTRNISRSSPPRHSKSNKRKMASVKEDMHEKQILDDDINSESSTEWRAASSGQHIMISYQWAHQNIAIRIKDELEKSGYRVWIDTESMGGSTLQAMADAVEKSAIVLICMSRRYKRSRNCRTEAGYAYKLQKDLIPIRVARGYDPDGWLGALQEAKLYFDFSDLPEFDTMMHKLKKEIGDKAKIVTDAIDGPRNIAKQHSAHPARARVEDWMSKEVRKWASQNNVQAKTLSSFDGRTLLFLRKLSCDAPEFYYRFVYDQLGVTALSSILNLNEALEALD